MIFWSQRVSVHLVWLLLALSGCAGSPGSGELLLFEAADEAETCADSCAANSRCFALESGTRCAPVPPRICEADHCECFERDPCTPESLGVCSEVDDQGIIVCR